MSELPIDYVPFENNWICSNTLEHGQVIFEIDGNPIVLFGTDSDKNGVRFWLKVPTQEQDSRTWKDAIFSNKVIDKSFALTTSPLGYEVTFKEHPILQFRVVDGRLIINLIDFRPIGLNLRGGLTSLNISGNNFSNNKFTNVNTMISIGI